MRDGMKASLALKHGIWLLASLAVLVITYASVFVFIDGAFESLTEYQVKIMMATQAIGHGLSLLLLSGLFVHPMIKRLRAATEAAEQLSAGDDGASIDTQGHDEVAKLSRAIKRFATHSGEVSNRLELDNQTLDYQAKHDELTGLSNRKYGNEAIAKLDTAVESQPVSILFLDLDGFKAVNDSHGHAIGDEILVAVSLRLKGVLDGDAELIRWGGDEFVVVLPSTSQQVAVSVAQSVADIFKHPFATSGGVHKLGCSVGLSTSRAGTSLEKVLQEADASMYKQKKLRHLTKVPKEKVSKRRAWAGDEKRSGERAGDPANDPGSDSSDAPTEDGKLSVDTPPQSTNSSDTDSPDNPSGDDLGKAA